MIRTNSKISVRCLLVCFAFAIGSVQGLAQSTSSVLQLDDEQWWYEFHLVELLFKQRGLTPFSNYYSAVRSDPRETVLVLFGNNRQVDFREVERFVRQGGAVIVANDQTTMLQDLGFIREGPLQAASPDEAYLGFEDCLRVTDVNQEHPLNRGVQEFIVNRSGFLSRISGYEFEWTPLASIPDPQARYRDAVLMAVGVHSRSGGKIVALADHTMLTNGMLWHGDNAIFAVNLAKWISEGRKRFLLLTSDQVGNSPLPSPELPNNLPPPPVNPPELTPKQMVAFANHLVTSLEDADVFNELATNGFPFLSDALLKRSILLLIVTVMLLLLLSRYLHSHYAKVSPLPDREMSNIADLRVGQRVESGEYHLAARQLVRDFNNRLTGASSLEKLTIKPDDIEIHASIFARPSIRRDLKRVLQLAMTDRRQIRRKEFQRLVKAVRRLDQFHRNGRLKLSHIV